jgi:hypothetical protein
MPRYSHTIRDANGKAIGIACGHTRHRNCSTPGCRRHADKLCDFPVLRDDKAATCDRPVCGGCALRVGPDRDFCQPHAREAQAAANDTDGEGQS